MAGLDQELQLRPWPLAAGMAIGGITGFAIWIATDTFALFPAFLGLGLVLGLVFSGTWVGERR